MTSFTDKQLNSPVKSRFSKRFLSVQLSTWAGLVLILSFVIFSQINIRRSRAWVDHTFDVLEAAQALEVDVLRIRSNLDGFVGKSEIESYLDYQSSLQSALRDISALKQLTQDNPAQTQKLDALNKLLEQKLPQRADVKGVQASQLQSSLDEIHRLTNDFIRAEHKLLDQRRSHLDRQGLITTGAAIGAILYSAIMFACVTWEQKRLRQSERRLNLQIESIELEQELSESLLTCRTLEESHQLMKDFLMMILPGSEGVIYEINNSRDQMYPAVQFGKQDDLLPHSPRDCWALRRGEDRLSDNQTLKLPCQLCQKLSSGNNDGIMCMPLQAHEQTIGIFHLTRVPKPMQPILSNLARQIALPLAVLKLQTELEYLSVHDPNTGLYNRRFLDEMLTRSIAYADRQNYGFEPAKSPYSVGLIFIDVDHFKRFNTDFGHDAGDAVLKDLAKLFKEMTREGTDVPCRYGGEEFLLILPGANFEIALEKAETIRQRAKLLGALLNRSMILRNLE